MIGSILFNGNVVREEDFIYQFRERILTSNHVDQQVRESKKVLLITGAWCENEFSERHIKEVLCEIGISSSFRNGYDENIQNLCVYHEWNNYFDQNPYVREVYQSSLASLARIKKFYQQRSGELLKVLQHHARSLKRELPGISMAQILSYAAAEEQWRMSQMGEKHLLQHYGCQEIQKTLAYLISGDELQTKISAELQEYAKNKSGVFADHQYQRQRQTMVERILSANSIFIFGGDISSLYYSLRFWQLQGALAEALLRGTNFYTVSAGSMILGQKIILYDDFHYQREPRAGHFEFFDYGFGLVSKITLFPHCKDRIQTDDPDNLAYLAHRFQGRVCVGLNEDSFLLLDAHRSEDGRLYPRYTSVGTKDGVYVFDPSGQKIRLDYGEQLVVPGTAIWEQLGGGSSPKTPPPSYSGHTLWAADK